jgi:hypothetical protein
MDVNTTKISSTSRRKNTTRRREKIPQTCEEKETIQRPIYEVKEKRKPEEKRGDGNPQMLLLFLA